MTLVTDDSLVKGTNVIPPQSFVLIHQFDLIVLKLTTYKEHSINKQNAEINSFIYENFTLEVVVERYVVMRMLWYIINRRTEQNLQKVKQCF